MEEEKKIDKKRVSLKNLYLDPNNYRFIDQKEYVKVSDSDIDNKSVQKRTLYFLLGEKQKNIEDLLKSFKANGFLEVDQIQVEDLGDGKYRVLEGNRRVSALKYLSEKHKEEGIDLGKLSEEIFKRVPIVVYENAKSGAHEIIMGLKHVTGNKKWPPLNQAQLIYDLINIHHWTSDKISESLGIDKHPLYRSLRTIGLIEDYKNSEFGDQFKTDQFAIFREVISSRPLKKWLDWNDKKRCPKNEENKEQLYSWLSSISEITTNIDGEDVEIEREAAITKSTEIATLAKIIEDPEAIKELDSQRNIIAAYSASSSVADDKYDKAINNIEHNIKDALDFVKYAKHFNKLKITSLKNELDSLLVKQGYKDLIVSKSSDKNILISYKNNQFSKVKLLNYKGFKKDLELTNLNRINLFAGENNVGKSSLLEAVYILANQNDIHELIEIYRRRGKFINSIPSSWLIREFRAFELQAIFDDKPVELKSYMSSEEDDSIDKSMYSKSLYIETKFNGDNPLISKARIYENKDMELFFKEINSICVASYSSPFTILSKELINEYHEISIERGTYAAIISFITKHVDAKITGITKVGDAKEIRFLVNHNDFDKAIDLTHFGEGLQRIFFISLQLAAAKNGIMCIDEIENAIHHSLLIQFTKFIQELAETYNVQLFITTHSNECIRAFFENGYKNNQITGYRFAHSKDGVVYKAAKGEALQNQIENFNLDLRG
ncbi:AAA family ATPase [Tenacibaculum finnmarkense]|uniref:AAA family ATPase n=1 Tax=Tenacibaculum finnmarkense TaxID=2781243 RepID=UPI00187B2317|nr:AAA family ATPase [Tenacibaculum finnmarkense]MBE7649016.1 AAA family ATPase [Tenacibaculum finnmarkense genomovar ulcerans]